MKRIDWAYVAAGTFIGSLFVFGIIFGVALFLDEQSRSSVLIVYATPLLLVAVIWSARRLTMGGDARR